MANNICGNQVMVETALTWGVGHFVLVSTDKAVRPTNIMGASKRICELIVQSYVGADSGSGQADECAPDVDNKNGAGDDDVVLPPEAGLVYVDGTLSPPENPSENPFENSPENFSENSPEIPLEIPASHPAEPLPSEPADPSAQPPTNPKTKFMAVRFGNVVGSSGSVIPLFREQIERGGPITVTHPDVTRYFMTIPEAAQLILQAGSQGEGGETFILEMGKSIKIADMARDLIRLSGMVPDEDIEIRFTGLRQGEKLYEELITEGEGIVSTSHEKIMVLKANGDWHGHGSRENYHIWLMHRLEGLYAAADEHDICAIKEKMQEIVPEFTVQDSKCVL